MNQPTAPRAPSAPDVVVAALASQAERFYAEDRLDRAQEILEILVKYRPDAGPFWSFLGVVHRRQDRLVPALQCLQRALDLDPDDKNALVNLGETLIIIGKVTEGAGLLRALFEDGYDPQRPPFEQDLFTRRAGAQLALLVSLAEEIP